MLLLLFFIIVSAVISYIDIKKGLILDKIMFPSFIVLLVLKYFEHTLAFENFIAIVIVLIIFVIPIILNMAFGGGDLRYGAFAALFLGLEPIGYFIMFSGLIHVILLAVIKKKAFPFAPAMSLGALGAYMVGNL
jgi:prepilin signal peptidase PulO-like enzyme (type II secretory pathway)